MVVVVVVVVVSFGRRQPLVARLILAWTGVVLAVVRQSRAGVERGQVGAGGCDTRTVLWIAGNIKTGGCCLCRYHYRADRYGEPMELAFR